MKCALHIYNYIYLERMESSLCIVCLLMLSALWVSRTGSASDWFALQEALYKCIDKIKYNTIHDSSQLTLLALFDVSAAFDTVDHEILLKRLNVSFGFSGTLLLWLRSFHTERSLRVVHGSSWVPAPFGLPQGSVLAPLLFIMDVV